MGGEGEWTTDDGSESAGYGGIRLSGVGYRVIRRPGCRVGDNERPRPRVAGLNNPSQCDGLTILTMLLIMFKLLDIGKSLK